MQQSPAIRLLEHCAAPHASALVRDGSLEPGEREYPTIETNVQLRDLVRTTWAVVKQANVPPCLFRHGGVLVRVALHDGHGGPRMAPLSKQGLLRFLVENADWRNGAANTCPPSKLLDIMLDEPDSDIPEIEVLTTIPVLTQSRKLLTAPGFDPDEQVYFYDSHGLANLSSDTPDIESVRCCLLDALHDFPFVSEADQTHAIAAILLPFVRPALKDACSPMWLIEAASPGTGKGLLADLISVIATGKPCTPTTLSSNPEENAKRLAALLAAGSSVIHLDNLSE
jgi:hypothetical protein